MIYESYDTYVDAKLMDYEANVTSGMSFVM